MLSDRDLKRGSYTVTTRIAIVGAGAIEGFSAFGARMHRDPYLTKRGGPSREMAFNRLRRKLRAATLPG